MRQPRMMSLVEAMANVGVGLLVAVATQLLAFPLLGLQASLGQNIKLALVFTGVSIARSYVLRRVFERRNMGSSAAALRPLPNAARAGSTVGPSRAGPP